MKPEDFKFSLIRNNFDRVISLLPFIIVISFLMFCLSFFLNDIEEVKWINGFFFTYCLLLYLIVQRGPIKNEVKLMQIWQNSVVVVFLLWGTLMLGFKPESVISYFDFVIVVVVSGVAIQMKWPYWLTYFILILCLLMWMPSFLMGIEDNKILTIVSILLFLMMVLYINQIFYKHSRSYHRINCELYVQQQVLEQKVSEKTEALLNSERYMMKEIALLLTTVLEYYDEYTKGHSESVALISEGFAKALGFDLAKQKEIYWAGLIHDIGKIHIDKELLNKPEALERAEYEIIKEHAKYGYEMTKNADALKEIALIIKHHHEKFDGSGYPEGLKGNEIPLASQIIAVADAWDVMRSDRIYRKALPLENARLELIKNSGTQFSPRLIEIFLELECAN